MILRIRATDFNNRFCGYAHGREYNEEIDKYINLYKTNEEIRSFEIECLYNDLNIHQIVYIAEQLTDCKMFTRVDFDKNGDSKNSTYVLCFVKLDNQKELVGENNGWLGK